MNKSFYCMLVFLTFLVSPNYIIVTAQLNPPEPVTTQWYVQEGDAFSWYVTTFRENGNVTFTELFYNYTTGESLNVTEGDIITITVLTLGNASEYEGTCLIQTGEEQLSTRLSDAVILAYPLIIPVFDRDYWVEAVAWSENQTSILGEFNLDGNLLTINTTSSNMSIKAFVDISTGLFHSLHFRSNVIELKIDLMTGFWFLNISFPTLLIIGVIGVEIIIVIFLVRLLRRRKLELS
ncbi:MAG: hypothetical protein ACFFC7_02670 [Candidatus Hermodarchaeota archaeon]